MINVKQVVLMVVCAWLSAVAPCFADSLNGETGSQNDVPVNAWADVQQTVQQVENRIVAYQNSVQSSKRVAAKTSKRTNTNLASTLPPTVTFASMTDLDVVDDGTFEPKVDVAGMLDSYYDNSTLIRERAEAAKDQLLPDQ